MTKLNLTFADGTERVVEASDGLSVMEVLRPLGIGIEGDCEGSAACATCHVWIDPDWFDQLAAPSDDEVDMLDCAFHARETSRLSCQIKVEPILDGLGIAVPHR